MYKALHVPVQNVLYFSALCKYVLRHGYQQMYRDLNFSLPYRQHK